MKDTMVTIRDFQRLRSGCHVEWCSRTHYGTIEVGLITPLTAAGMVALHLGER